MEKKYQCGYCGTVGNFEDFTNACSCSTITNTKAEGLKHNEHNIQQKKWKGKEGCHTCSLVYCKYCC